MNYILPNFYTEYRCNEVILSEFSHKLITGLEGGLPFNIFFGGPNSNLTNPLVVHEDIASSIKPNKTYFINMANCLISSEKYFYDELTTVIIEEFYQNNNFYFEVANPNFISFLVKTYPEIQLIIHHNFFLKYSFDEFLSLVKQYDNIKGVIFNAQILPQEKIDNIPNHLVKIGLLCLNGCHECISYKKCMANDLKATFDYSIASNFTACDSCMLRNIEGIEKDIAYLKTLKVDYLLFDTVLKKYHFEGFKIIEDLFERNVL